jgi:hypothetical protein
VLTVLAQSAVDVLDEVVQLFDQAVSARESRAKHKLADQLAERAKRSEDKLAIAEQVLPVLADPAVADEQVGGLLRERIGMGRLRAALAEPATSRLPRDHGHLAQLASPHGYLRQFTSQVLEAITFGSGPAAAELLEAVAVLRSLNATGARSVPAEAPDGFVPARWRGYLDQTDLPITEHATDTHGASLLNFALFDLCGPQLSPRIRDLGKITLYRARGRAEVCAQFPVAGLLLTRRVNFQLIAENWDEMLRLAASLKYGYVTASLIVAKLSRADRHHHRRHRPRTRPTRPHRPPRPSQVFRRDTSAMTAAADRLYERDPAATHGPAETASMSVCESLLTPLARKPPCSGSTSTTSVRPCCRRPTG